MGIRVPKVTEQGVEPASLPQVRDRRDLSATGETLAPVLEAAGSIVEAGGDVLLYNYEKDNQASQDEIDAELFDEEGGDEEEIKQIDVISPNGAKSKTEEITKRREARVQTKFTKFSPNETVKNRILENAKIRNRKFNDWMRKSLNKAKENHASQNRDIRYNQGINSLRMQSKTYTDHTTPETRHKKKQIYDNLLKELRKLHTMKFYAPHRMPLYKKDPKTGEIDPNEKANAAIAHRDWQQVVDQGLGGILEEEIEKGNYDKVREILNDVQGTSGLKGMDLSPKVKALLRKKMKTKATREEKKLNKALRANPYEAYEAQGVDLPKVPSFNPNDKFFVDNWSDYFERSLDLNKKGRSGKLKNKVGGTIRSYGSSKRIADKRVVEQFKRAFNEALDPGKKAKLSEKLMESLDSLEKKRLFLEQLAPTTQETTPGAGASSKNMDLHVAIRAAETDVDFSERLHRGIRIKQTPGVSGGMTEFNKQLEEELGEYSLGPDEVLQHITAAKLWALDRMFPQDMKEVDPDDVLKKADLINPDKTIEEYIEEAVGGTITLRKIQSFGERLFSFDVTGSSAEYKIPTWKNPDGEWASQVEGERVFSRIDADTIKRYYETKGLRKAKVYYGKPLDTFYPGLFQIMNIGPNRYKFVAAQIGGSGDLKVQGFNKSGKLVKQSLILDMTDFQKFLEKK